VWVTLGYRGVEQGDGVSVIEWDATVDYCFPGSSGPIVHGGLVTTILDTAMGGACHSVLAAHAGAPLRKDQLDQARSATLTSALPWFSPLSIPMNARGAFSSPSVTSSRQRMSPFATQRASLRAASS
jgi:hypothetical protein